MDQGWNKSWMLMARHLCDAERLRSEDYVAGKERPPSNFISRLDAYLTRCTVCSAQSTLPGALPCLILDFQESGEWGETTVLPRMCGPLSWSSNAVSRLGHSHEKSLLLHETVTRSHIENNVLTFLIYDLASTLSCYFISGHGGLS